MIGPNRNIRVFGNPDTDPHQGFPDPETFQRFIREDVFQINVGRYRYTRDYEVDVIVLSRVGIAYGHFVVERREEPTSEDRADYPRVRCVYIVRSSALYNRPVQLFQELGIKVNQTPPPLSEEQFQQIVNLAGGFQEFRLHPAV